MVFRRLILKTFTKLAGITILSKVNTLYSLSWLWRVYFYIFIISN
nr:MAG TPA: hypothetical protein [Caudoviricetes sp.]